jgi:hypothetical protein
MGAKEKRNVIGVELGARIYWSLHASSAGGGYDALLILKNIVANSAGNAWVAVGDWNR